MASSIWAQLSYHLWWSDAVELPEVTSVTWPEQALSGSMLCACATRSCEISVLVGPFDRKWRHFRKRPCPEVCSAHTRLFPRFFCYYSSTIFDRKWRQTNVSGRGPVRKYVLRMPGFFPPFFLSSSTSTMATEGHVTPTSPEEFSHNASLYVIINYPDRWRYYLVTW